MHWGHPCLPCGEILVGGGLCVNGLASLTPQVLATTTINKVTRAYANITGILPERLNLLNDGRILDDRCQTIGSV